MSSWSLSWVQHASFARADVTDEEQVGAAVARAASAPLGLRVAVSAAGIATVEKTVGRDGTPHALHPFRDMLEVNLVGAFNLCAQRLRP